MKCTLVHADILGPQSGFLEAGHDQAGLSQRSLAENWDSPVTDSTCGQEEDRRVQAPLTSWGWQMGRDVSLEEVSNQLPIWSPANIKGQAQVWVCMASLPGFMESLPLEKGVNRSDWWDWCLLLLADLYGCQMGACSWVTAHGLHALVVIVL